MSIHAANFRELRLDRLCRDFGTHNAVKDVSLTIRQGEFIALLGPSGCGKSTTLNLIAGLLPATGGGIWLDERRIDPLRPEERGFGMVFQSYALFPHMSVRKNVGFGLAMQGIRGADADKRVMDALALVRFGLRAPDNPRIVNTVKVIDALLKKETATGPVWHRYNGDQYGEHEDGSPFDGTGIGRGWPFLAGERAHYELVVGNRAGAEALLRVMEAQANPGGLIPEQVWDAPDIPELELFNGRPTGAAMPLVWAHAEYIKLLRSLREGRVFDLPPQTVQRYQRQRVTSGRSIWRFLRTYVFQLGVLDGMHGLVFCMLQAYGTYLKWALLWGWHVNAARGRMPPLPIFDDSEETWRGLESETPAAAK